MSFASFLYCYHHARQRAITNRNIRRAFEGCGLIPEDPERVLRKVREDKEEREKRQAEQQARSLGHLDPYNLPATPRNIKTLDEIMIAGRDPNATSRQLLALLTLAVRAAHTALTEQNLLRQELENLRTRQKPPEALSITDTPGANRRSRKREFAEHLTTEAYLQQESEIRRQQEEEVANKQLRADEAERRRREKAVEEEEKRKRSEELRMARELKKKQDAEARELKKQRDADAKELKRQQESIDR